MKLIQKTNAVGPFAGLILGLLLYLLAVKLPGSSYHNLLTYGAGIFVTGTLLLWGDVVLLTVITLVVRLFSETLPKNDTH